jgi:hypothetical protein
LTDSDEEIIFGKFARPYLRVKSTACRCGRPVYLGVLCEACTKEESCQELLRRQEAILECQPDLEVGIGHDERNLKHIAMIGCQTMAFCGQKLRKQKKDTRTWVPAGKIPANVCMVCRGLVERARKVRKK